MIIGMRYSDFSGQYVYTENEEYKQVIWMYKDLY